MADGEKNVIIGNEPNVSTRNRALPSSEEVVSLRTDLASAQERLDEDLRAGGALD